MIFKKGYLEKRAHERAECYCLVKYRPLYQKGVYTETITSVKNISGGGLLLKLKEPHLLGARLEIKINLPMPDDSAITTIAEVVRPAVSKKSKGYWVGVKFIDIKEEDRKRIADFIKLIKNSENENKY
ncbi:MAG: PilZ domain-containing protein [Candidatus Omnitrophota bacterium]|nr:PilZ domain-containing protein [Candidatus Omnitrophota bacterium]